MELGGPVSPLICLTKLVTFIMKEPAYMMTNTNHLGDWYFYYDALSLMTANGTRDWTKKTEIDGKNCMSKWLVPMLGCNKCTPFEN